MKMCAVCGHAIEDTTKECPNCGSYDFRTIESKGTVSIFKRWR